MGALSGLRWLLFLNILVGIWLIVSAQSSYFPAFQPKDPNVKLSITVAGAAVILFSLIAWL